MSPRPAPAPRWALLPHVHGTPAQPRVQAWLAEACGGHAADYAFEREPHGRPRLAHPALDCNWSHSGDALLVACGTGQRIGVDLERLRPRANALALAQRYFAATEIAWLGTQADPEHAFLRLWCAKEAVLKAHGRGLAFGLHRLAFAETDGVLKLQGCDYALGDPRDWSLQEFAPAPGLLAALAWRHG